MQTIISGIPAVLVRKKIKYLYITVQQDGTVRLSAPLQMSENEIERFVASRKNWILRKQEEQTRIHSAFRYQYETGEILYIRGNPYRLEVTYDTTKDIILLPDRLLLPIPDNSTRAQREALLYAWYRTQLREDIAALLPVLEAKTGLHSTSWQIRNMKTRYGTCNVRSGKIWLNLQLIKAPTRCLEYVILHELLHLQVPNHSAAFYALLDQYMPQWRVIRKELRNFPPEYSEK